jgi:hypothetical protein
VNNIELHLLGVLFLNYLRAQQRTLRQKNFGELLKNHFPHSNRPLSMQFRSARTCRRSEFDQTRKTALSDNAFSKLKLYTSKPYPEEFIYSAPRYYLVDSSLIIM